jgi:hypothetical protein
MKQHLRITEDAPRSFISIGPKCIDAACELLDQHLRMKANAIDAAYVKLDEGEKLNVSLSVKFSEGVRGSINVESAISFTAEKVKDTGGRLVNERQEKLPGIE